jgi:hypothetical protein
MAARSAMSAIDDPSIGGEQSKLRDKELGKS